MANICQFVCPYRTPISGYATCPHRKMAEPPTIKSAEPMTNADKIRQMTDDYCSNGVRKGGETP